jgi:hypothetical protein
METYKVSYHKNYPFVNEIKVTKGVWFQESITLSFNEYLCLSQGLFLDSLTPIQLKFLAEMRKAGVWF